MKSIYTAEQIQFMKDNYNKMSYKEIADTLGFTERQIRGRINNMGLTKLRKINDHYFDVIDTPLKAYFLGFIYADGWISYNEETRNYEFGMELKKQDEYILEKLNEELGGVSIISHKPAKHKVIKNVPCVSGEISSLRVYSKNLVLGLEHNNVLRNKTQFSTIPHVENPLFWDFLRGYIDGDGCYHINKRGYLQIHITCCHKEPLEYIQNRLSEYDIKSHIYSENDKKQRLVFTSQNDSEKLIKRLYYNPNVFCLNRKLDIINNYYLGSVA